MNIHEWTKHREEANEKILESNHLGIQRFFNLDTRAYEDGALPQTTKELCGLVASLVLRCDDCVTYHLAQCVKLGLTDAQLHDAMNVGLVVGGSIVIRPPVPAPASPFRRFRRAWRSRGEDAEL